MVTPLMKGDEEVVDLKNKFDTAVANHPEVPRPDLMVLRHTHVHPPDEPDGVLTGITAMARWRRTSPTERSEILRNAFELMRADADRLTELIMLENGKPEADARGEVAYAAEFFRWFAEEAVRPGGEYGEAPSGGSRTVVLKPAAETPLTAMAIIRLLIEAGVPDGVVNLVPTSDAGGVVSTWLQDPRVRKISFTGSTPVGRILLKQAADRVVNSSMELGGNAPFIVTDDADLDAAVEGALVAKFRNGGQACTAANRFFVHEAVVDDFTAKFGAVVEAFRVAPAADSGAQIGPVAHRTLLPGDLTGYFVAPAVLRDVSPDASIVREEIFGPVAPIVTFSTDEEVLDYVNASEYGLAAYVFAGDLRRALKLAEGIEAGMVGINRGLVSDPAAPFGGVKQSGLGREGAREGLLEFTETQYYSIDWPE